MHNFLFIASKKSCPDFDLDILLRAFKWNNLIDKYVI